jgi:hypothetical protein
LPSRSSAIAATHWHDGQLSEMLSSGYLWLDRFFLRPGRVVSTPKPRSSVPWRCSGHAAITARRFQTCFGRRSCRVAAFMPPSGTSMRCSCVRSIATSPTLWRGSTSNSIRATPRLMACGASLPATSTAPAAPVVGAAACWWPPRWNWPATTPMSKLASAFFQSDGGQGRCRTRAREGGRRVGSRCRACERRADPGLLRRGTAGGRQNRADASRVASYRRRASRPLHQVAQPMDAIRMMRAYIWTDWS